MAGLIREAQEGRAHEALGFPSWTAYVSAVCSDTPLMRLSRDERRVIVADLAEQGMSTRAIAPVVGTTKDSVHRDLKVSRSATPAPVPTFDPTPAWDPTTGEVVEPRTVTGLDGKTYTRPAPQEDADDMPQKITRKRPPTPSSSTVPRPTSPPLSSAGDRGHLGDMSTETGGVCRNGSQHPAGVFLHVGATIGAHRALLRSGAKRSD